jgi:photosystem II stability/assembly factor-like uncharacterized protein
MSDGGLANRLLRLAALSIAFAAAVDGVGAPPRWIAIGPPGAEGLVAAADPAFPDRVYAAARDEVYLSLDGGLIFSGLGPLPLERSPFSPLFISDIAVLRGPGADQPGAARLVVQLYTPTNAPSLYVSFDGGRSWKPGVDAETGNPIEGNWLDLAAVPGSASVVFAVSGFSSDSANFRTDDGGSTWRALQLPSVRGQARFVPVTENLLLVAGDEAGVFRSTDGGTSWVSISGGLPVPPYHYIAIGADSRAPTTLWVVIADMGTFRSQDAGATWTQQGDAAGVAPLYPTDLFVDGDTLFALSNAAYVYRSRDGGRTWKSLNIAPNAALGPIVARDATTGRLYFGNIPTGSTPTNLRFSQDDGDTLYPSERGLHGVDAVHIAADASGRLYSWAEGRLYRREAVRDLWQDITPSNSEGCAGFYGPGPIVVTADGTLFVPAKDYTFVPAKDYICRSVDGGEHWIPTPASSPQPVNRYWLLAVAPDDHNVMYARYDTLVGFGGILTSTTIYRSFDSGLHWTPISQPFTITDRLYATGGGKLIALRSGVLAVSPDGGNYWLVSLTAVRDLSVSASRPQIALVAGDGGMYRTDDGGGTFARLGALPDASITQVALHPNADHVAYAVTDRGRVYLSTDGGATWAAVGGTLDPIVELFDVVAAAAAPSTLIAGTTHGVQTIYAASDQRELAEFYHPAFDHYFISADPEEVFVLRQGGLPPWRPTGRWFWGWESDASGSSPVCRFWSGQTFAPKSSHFYTPYPDECQGLRQGNVWLFEGQAFGWRLPTGAVGSRVCPAENWPLYRAYNNGQGGAPNHRYTTDPAMLDAMLAQGWIMEGEASTRVFACVPARQ